MKDPSLFSTILSVELFTVRQKGKGDGQRGRRRDNLKFKWKDLHMKPYKHSMGIYRNIFVFL